MHQTRPFYSPPSAALFLEPGQGAFAGRDLNGLGALLAHDNELRRSAWLQCRDSRQELGHIAHRAARHLGDDVTRADAGAGRRTVLEHAGDDHAGIGAQAKALGQLGREILRFDADPAARDLPVAHDGFQHVLAVEVGMAKPMPMEPPERE